MSPGRGRRRGTTAILERLRRIPSAGVPALNVWISAMPERLYAFTVRMRVVQTRWVRASSEAEALEKIEGGDVFDATDGDYTVTSRRRAKAHDADVFLPRLGR